MSELKEVYRAKNPLQGGLVVAMLEQNQIASSMDGAILAAGGGELPLGWSTAPRVMVSSEDFEEARRVVSEWEAAGVARAAADDSAQAKVQAMWSCPNCAEEVEYEFEMCWNCQYNRTAC
ncbi:MAG: DUF2007 domain-containing protein [Fuerstiella sp.]